MTEIKKAGKYEILHRIGEGGFGVVYQGRDPFIKRSVAIKTCTSDNEETRKRFLREAEIAGNIEHPNITIVYDFGYEEGTPYLVQEFLSGEDLDHKIERREQIPLLTKLDYLMQIAQGLGFAHEQEILHRDIKPANIRILDDDRVKIMDFGIAKLASVETQLTQTGTTLGTPAYLSPEQLRGDEVDQRSDIYSYGVMAFELLTYRRLFLADNISSLFFQILHQPASRLREIWPGCPHDLDELVARCVEKDPAKRVQSFRQAIASLQSIMDEVRRSGDVPLPTSAYGLVDAQREDKGEVQRQQALTQARNQIEDLLASGELKAAARALLEARQSFGDLVPFRTLHDRLVQLQTASDMQVVEEGEELRAVVDVIRDEIDAGNLEEAAAKHQQALALFGEGHSLLVLGRQIRARQKVAEGRALLDRSAVEPAWEALQRAYELDPQVPAIAEMLHEVDERRNRRDRSSRVAGLLAEAGRLLAAGQLQPARERVADALREAPGDADAQRLEREIRQALESAGEVTVIGPRPPSFGPPAAAPLPVSPPTDATVLAPAARPAPAAGRRPAPWIAAAAALAVVAVVAVLAWMLIGGGGAAPRGAVALDAAPWAEVTEIVAANGSALDLTALGAGAPPFYTPLYLELEPGEYRATLRRPGASTPRTVDFRVEAGGVATSRVELEPIDAESYFQEVGW
ncbi:MAG TPA: serine/threonine-protein kinase [Thermoanaerobaculia bacterium]|nr:serine/threonine-protein kinase [Thermoanaerobaculia bacterium]